MRSSNVPVFGDSPLLFQAAHLVVAYFFWATLYFQSGTLSEY